MEKRVNHNSSSKAKAQSKPQKSSTEFSKEIGPKDNSSK